MQPWMRRQDVSVRTIEVDQAAAAPAIITIVERIGGDDQLIINSFRVEHIEAQNVFGDGRMGLAQGARLIFQKSQQQARAHTVIAGYIIYNFCAAAVLIPGPTNVIFQPACMRCDESTGGETNFGRALNESVIRYDLERAAP